ncbi:translation initiation factor eIF 4e-like domain-containing protein [Melampsora americana]|nr:translation initiation factor eIF 4e-like domain-containing protein [Melampsora americana]
MNQTQPIQSNIDPKRKSYNNLKSTHHSPPITRRLGSFNSLASLPIQSKDSLKSSSDESIDQTLPLSSKDNLHPLRSQWVFWILNRSPNKKMNEEEFGKSMKSLGSFDSVETFYPLYLHLKRPSTLSPISDLHLFKSPIKPVWEDPENVKGGKWTIRLRKGLSDRLWESLVFSLIGGGIEKLISNGETEKVNEEEEICGAVLSIRKDEDLLAVWHKNGDNQLAGDGKIAKKIKLSLLLSLPPPPSEQKKPDLNSFSSLKVIDLWY